MAVQKAKGAAGPVGAAAPGAEAAAKLTLDELVAKIKDTDPEVRTAAWLRAGEVGAPAVRPLADIVGEMETEVSRLAKSPQGAKAKETIYKLEVGRAAKRALWQIVHHAGRPGASAEKKAVLQEMISLLRDNRPTSVKREVLWMLSDLGGDESVEPVAAFLSDKQLREYARMVLERIPGPKSLAALKAGFAAAPEDFKLNIVQSLRARGVEVPGYPCRKLVPTRQTKVKPVG